MLREWLAGPIRRTVLRSMQLYRSAFLVLMVLLVAPLAPPAASAPAPGPAPPAPPAPLLSPASAKSKARGWLGVALKELKPPPAADGKTGPARVLVQKVFDDSAAQAAGVLDGDIVLDLDGRPVTSMGGMVSYVGKQRVGHVLKLLVRRQGADLALQATLAKRPDRKRQLSDRWLGRKLPDGLVLTDVASGGKVTLADLQGTPFIIDYWATTCGPCKVAHPIVRRLRDRHAEAGVRVLAVSYEKREKVASFAASHAGYERDVMVDPQGYFASKLGMFSLPTFVYVDAGGVIRSVAFGLFGLQRFEHDVEVAEAARKS